MKRSDPVKNDARGHPHAGVISRSLGVLRSPRAMMAEVAAHPTWLGMLAFLAVTIAMLSFAFLSTESGEFALLDAAVRQLENVGVEVDDARYGWLMDRVSNGRWLVSASALIGIPILAFVVAAVIFCGFRLAGDRSARFAAVFAIVVHSGVVLSLPRLVVLPLNYINESLSVPTNLGVMLPMLEETSLLAGFLGGIDLFTVWWLLVVAIGLSVVYPPTAKRIALRLLACYVVVVLGIALVITTLRIS